MVRLSFKAKLKPRLQERLFFFLIVASPGRGENRMCSHACPGDVRTSRTLSPSVATTARRRRGKFQTNRITVASKKIAPVAAALNW